MTDSMNAAGISGVYLPNTHLDDKDDHLKPQETHKRYPSHHAVLEPSQAKKLSQPIVAVLEGGNSPDQPPTPGVGIHAVSSSRRALTVVNRGMHGD